MSIPETQRVGVFSESTVSKDVMGFPGSCLPVGIVATVDEAVYTTTPAVAHAIASYDEAKLAFGKDSEMAKLVQIFDISGVNKLVCVPVLAALETPSTEEYETALGLLASEEAVQIVVCDTTDATIHGKIRDHCNTACQNMKERRSHVGVTEELSVSATIALAGPINSGLVTMWDSVPLKSDGTAYESSVYLAAACAAQDALELDPAMPLHNLQLPASLFGGIYNKRNESDFESLYDGGVAACRSVNGKISIDRSLKMIR